MALARLAIFCALECEARFFIDSLKLKKIDQIGSFKFFSDGIYHVIISGIGEKNIALSVALFKGLFPHFKGYLLNVGIAGHKNLEIGTIYSINQILKSQSSDRFYLNPQADEKLPLKPLKTIKNPDSDYDPDYIQDMEAFFFLEAALNFYSSDQIHVIKIISDNETENHLTINKEKVISLFYKNKLTFFNFFKNRPEVLEDSVQPVLEKIKTQFSPSESKSHQIKKLLERVAALDLSIDHLTFKNLDQLELHLKTCIESSIKL